MMVRPPSTSSERFIKTIFLLLGVGILLPWNAYISAKQYFVSRLCKGLEDTDTSHNIGQEIETYFSIFYNGAGVLSLIVVILVQHQVNKYYVTSPTKKRMKSVKSFIFENTSRLSVSMMSSTTSSLRSIDTTGHASTDHTTWYMVMIPLAIYLVVFAISTILVFIIYIPTATFFFITLSGLFVCGVCTAVASSGVVGTAGLFPANFGVNPFFNGQAIGGLFVSCANFVASFLDGSEHFQSQYCLDQSSATLTFDVKNQSIDEEIICLPYGKISLATAGYFSMGGLVLALCMIGYSCIDRFKHLARKNVADMEDKNAVHCSDEADIDNELLIEGLIPGIQELSLDQERDAPDMTMSSQFSNSYQNSSRDINQVRRQSSSDTDNSEKTQNLTLSVWKSVRGTALSLFLTYFCTLAVFPTWTSELISRNQCKTTSRMRNDLFVPLSFIIFNGGDLVGRYISSAIKFELILNLSNKLVWFSVARMLLFFFLFLSCKAQRNRYEDWIVVDDDLYSWCIQFAFAVTNGVLTNLAFCHAPSLVENQTNSQQVASAILNLALTLGLTIGSFFSVPFLKFARGEMVSNRR